MGEAGKAAAAWGLQRDPAGPGCVRVRAGGHSPARVVVEVLQHRVAEEGPGRTLEAHWALRVQVVGARRGPCSHQRQEQRAGAPRRPSAPPSRPSPVGRRPPRAPRAGRRARRRRGRGPPTAERLLGPETCARAQRDAVPGWGRWAERAPWRAQGRPGAAGVLCPAEKCARSERVGPGGAGLVERRACGGRPEWPAAERRSSASLRAASPAPPPAAAEGAQRPAPAPCPRRAPGRRALRPPYLYFCVFTHFLICLFVGGPLILLIF